MGGALSRELDCSIPQLRGEHTSQVTPSPHNCVMKNRLFLKSLSS